MTRDLAKPARLIKGVGGNYWIRTAEGHEGMAQARGIFRKDKIKPLPGDLVRYGETGEQDVPYVVNEILPRRNALQRPPLANLDGLVLVFALKDPDPDLLLLDKLISLGVSIEVPVFLVFSKEDLFDRDPTDLVNIYEGVVAQLYVSDGSNEAVLDALRAFAQNKLVTVAGPSGAGKSTLVNRLFGVDHMEVGEVSARTGRGRQTTRHTELFWHGNGYFADSPGFSSLDVEQMGIEATDLMSAYHDLGADSGQCRFNSCRHLQEPGCIVKERLEAGEADIGRYERYVRLREELDQLTDW